MIQLVNDNIINKYCYCIDCCCSTFTILCIHNNKLGPLPSPTNLFVPSQSPPTNITLTWDQPLGADTVTGYRINYAYEVIECSKENPLPFPPVTVTLNNGSLRTYTIIQSLSFPVNEDSNYMISVTSVNSVTESCPSNTVYTTSAQAGKCIFL